MRLDESLLARIEDASLNASAPPQQRWMDGWLMRYSPGKAKRARCINAVGAGRQPLADKLAWADRSYREAGLPLFVRVTPFTRPADLDPQLAALGYQKVDDTRVMVLPDLPDLGPVTLPPRCKGIPLRIVEYRRETVSRAVALEALVAIPCTVEPSEIVIKR